MCERLAYSPCSPTKQEVGKRRFPPRQQQEWSQWFTRCCDSHLTYWQVTPYMEGIVLLVVIVAVNPSRSKQRRFLVQRHLKAPIIGVSFTWLSWFYATSKTRFERDWPNQPHTNDYKQQMCCSLSQMNCSTKVWWLFVFCRLTTITFVWGVHIRE